MLILEGDGEYEQQVAGESFHQQHLELIVGGRTQRSAECYTEAELIPDRTNPEDKLAVKVRIMGYTVGYLPKREARVYRKWLLSHHGKLQVAVCPALIRGGWSRDGDRGYFGVVLDLPAFG